jgi:hypothetical protein
MHQKHSPYFLCNPINGKEEKTKEESSAQKALALPLRKQKI